MKAESHSCREPRPTIALSGAPSIEPVDNPSRGDGAPEIEGGHDLGDAQRAIAADGGGQLAPETQSRSAPAENSDSGQTSNDTHGSVAAGADAVQRMIEVRTRFDSAGAEHSVGHCHIDSHSAAVHPGNADQGAGQCEPEDQVSGARPNPSSNGHGSIEAHPSGAVAGDGAVQGASELHRKGDSAIAKDPAGQGTFGPQRKRAGQSCDGEGHVEREVHFASALTIAEIREQWRERQDHHSTEKALTLRLKARCRRLCGGDKAEAAVLYNAMLGKGKVTHALAAQCLALNLRLLEARGVIEEHRLSIEKRLCELVKLLPVYGWWCGLRGCSDLGLAGIVGEAGDLADYSAPGKLWKRFGLAPYQGRAYATWRTKGGLSADDWTEAGYSPARRSVIWSVGDAVFKHQSQRADKETGEVTREAGPYRVVYDNYKARKTEELPEESKGHIHNMALRYMEKRLLKNLWQAWRAASSGVGPIRDVPPAETSGQRKGDDRCCAAA